MTWSSSCIARTKSVLQPIPRQLRVGPRLFLEVPVYIWYLIKTAPLVSYHRPLPQRSPSRRQAIGRYPLSHTRVSTLHQATAPPLTTGGGLCSRGRATGCSANKTAPPGTQDLRSRRPRQPQAQPHGTQLPHPQQSLAHPRAALASTPSGRAMVSPMDYNMHLY